MATATVPAERTALGVLRGLLISVRPKQVTKNGLILFALFFTVGQWWDTTDIPSMAAIVGRGVAAFAIFTLITSAVYLINDIFDIERDRAHPHKRKRPIASGAVPVALASGFAGILGLGGLAIAFVLSHDFFYVALGYAVLMQAYNLYIKNMVILDTMSIAAGFVLRAVAGSVAIDGSTVHGEPLDLTISPWLYIVTALGALFMALAKRRGELAQAGDNLGVQREALTRYNLPYLDMLIAMVAPATLIAYSLYTFSGGAFGSTILPENNSMMFTIPFVAYGLFRYLYLMYTRSLGESPEEILLTDRPMLADIFLWLLTAATVLVLNR